MYGIGCRTSGGYFTLLFAVVSNIFLIGFHQQGHAPALQTKMHQAVNRPSRTFITSTNALPIPKIALSFLLFSMFI
jgi:hypothetical protein